MGIFIIISLLFLFIVGNVQAVDASFDVQAHKTHEEDFVGTAFQDGDHLKGTWSCNATFNITIYDSTKSDNQGYALKLDGKTGTTSFKFQWTRDINHGYIMHMENPHNFNITVNVHLERTATAAQASYNNELICLGLIIVVIIVIAVVWDLKRISDKKKAPQSQQPVYQQQDQWPYCLAPGYYQLHQQPAQQPYYQAPPPPPQQPPYQYPPQPPQY